VLLVARAAAARPPLCWCGVTCEHARGPRALTPVCTPTTRAATQPHAEAFGAACKLDAANIANFGEEVVRGQPVFVLSGLLGDLERQLRSAAGAGAWQVRPARVAGPRAGAGAPGLPVCAERARGAAAREHATTPAQGAVPTSRLAPRVTSVCVCVCVCGRTCALPPRLQVISQQKAMGEVVAIELAEIQGQAFVGVVLLSRNLGGGGTVGREAEGLSASEGCYVHAALPGLAGLRCHHARASACRRCELTCPSPAHHTLRHTTQAWRTSPQV
jgi:hypothetical protein